MPSMSDRMFLALTKYRLKKYEKCRVICDEILDKNPQDLATWALKAQLLAQMVYVDESEVEENGIAEVLLDEHSMSKVSRPGTSFNATNTNSSISKAIRPTTQSGRPVSGFVRPGSESGRPGTMEQALKTARTARSARPISTASGRYVRLGTASMISSPDGPFINIARLNFNKYGADPKLAKILFQYIYYQENDVKNATELAAVATQATNFGDWWWKMQLGKCYFRMGLYRESEKQWKSAEKLQPMIDIYLYLSKVYCKLDQPLAAIEVLKKGISLFPDEVFLLTNIARIQELLNNVEESQEIYRKILTIDSVHVESIASIATHHFYTDQPEVALRYFRRLLQLGVGNAEMFNNLGLCCFYAQQWDMTLGCFERAISLAEEDNVLSDIWYNVAHIAISTADNDLASECLKLCLSANSDHAEAYNNLGVLELKRGNFALAKAFLQAAMSLNGDLYEAHYNYAALSDQVGQLQNSYECAKKAVAGFPHHNDSQHLLEQLSKHFAML
ncbi:tetratricopeptide repeat protein 8-like [Convolutriloba macropyga]|uniref:tetratricopeptide repeat protein 8-like n=1 Tax=Convolutriloba macropyga TaxID=536237 RepID=UPI003F526C52